VKKKMTEKTPRSYPKIAFTIAVLGGVIILLSGLLLAGASSLILYWMPHVNVTPSPEQVADAKVAAVESAIGIISGIIVIASAVMLRRRPSQRETWGIRILFFSVLSILCIVGIPVGSFIGIAAGIMILRWKPPKF
jgi:hypothetical protein